MNEDPNAQWFLPESLDINKSERVALQAAELRNQLKPRAVSPFARQSPQEFERTRARDRVPHIYDDLVRVDRELAASRGRWSVQRLREARTAIAHRLAENLATLGNYQLAAEVEPDTEQQKEYAAIVRALVLDDGYKCRCAPGKLYVKRWIFSDKHKRMMPLIACTGCDTMNVSTLPDELVKLRAAREKAQALVKGKTPEQAAQILRAAGLTTEKIIRR